MKSRKIKSKIWKDSWFASLSRSSKILFLYLLTCDDVGLSGYAELPDRIICFETGLSNAELAESKIELNPKVLFFNEWVYVVNLSKHDPIKSEKNPMQSVLQKEIDSVPEEIMNYFGAARAQRERSEGAAYGNGKGNGKGNGNGKGKEKKKQVGYSTIEDLTDDVCDEVAKHHDVATREVIMIREQMRYHEWKGEKPPKDFKRALHRWVLNAIKWERIGQGKYTPTVRISPEEMQLEQADKTKPVDPEKLNKIRSELVRRMSV